MMKKKTRIVLALMMIVSVIMSFAISSSAATMPSCSGQKVSNRNSSSFRFDFTIKNPSRVSVPQCGAQIRPKGGGWTTHTENIVAKHRTLASCPVWYEVGRGKEFNYTLNTNTDYEIRGFCKYGGKTYYSGIVTVPRWNQPSPTPTQKMNNFINDGRWKNGVAWGPTKKGYLTSWGQGCAAYCADFVKYCFNKNAPNTGSYFTSVSAIKAGDVLHVYNSRWGEHWIAVISRSGNSLKVAEGNVLKNKSYVTMVSTGTWVISGNNLYSNYAKVTYTTNHARIQYSGGGQSSPFGGWHYM